MTSSSTKLGFVEQVVLLAMMISMVALSIDVMLPALLPISQDLQANSPNDRQYVISAVFLGLAVGQLFYGPISDSTGRKPAIYFGFGLFLVGCLLSIFAENFTVMLIGRFLQGLGVASPRIVSLALIRDQYEGREMARFVSLVMTVFILVPILAPAVGQGILFFAEWRMIFVTLFMLGFATLLWFGLRQEETLVPEKRAPFSLRRIWRAVKEVIYTRAAFGFTMVGGRQYYEKLVSPENKPGRNITSQPGTAGPLHDVKGCHYQDISAESKDDGRGMQRAQPTEICPGQIEIQNRKGQLQGDNKSDRKSYNTPESGRDNTGFQNLCIVINAAISIYQAGGAGIPVMPRDQSKGA